MPSPFARVFALLIAMCATASIGHLHAQDSASPAPDAPSGPCIEPCLRAGTLVELEIVEALDSATRKRGDTFAIRLHAPLARADRILVAAGTPGIGEIVHADRSRGGGKPGELLIAARYLQLGDIRIPLRGLKFGGQGQDRSAAALGLSLAVGVFAQFVHGREIVIPPGTLVTAKLSRDFPLADADTLPTPASLPGTLSTNTTTATNEE